jgi:hypothetical protein
MIRKIIAAVLTAAAVTVGLVVVSPGPAMAAGGWTITNYGSGRCVAPMRNSTDRNVPLVLSNAPCATTWNIVDVPNTVNYKYIKLDANSARCMVPGGSSTVKNAVIVSGVCGTTISYEWLPYLVPTNTPGHDYYQLANGANNSLCLAVVGNSTAAGAALVQAPCHRDAPSGQLFTW